MTPSQRILDQATEWQKKRRPEELGPIKVSLTSADAWPNHNIHPSVGGGKFKKWRGKEILVWPAERPTDVWTCDTKNVYSVHSETLQKVGISPDYFGMIFVCEHQIEFPACVTQRKIEQERRK